MIKMDTIRNYSLTIQKTYIIHLSMAAIQQSFLQQTAMEVEVEVEEVDLIKVNLVHILPAAVVVIPQAVIWVARVHPAHLVQVVVVLAMIIAHITQALIMAQLRLTPIPTHMETITINRLNISSKHHSSSINSSHRSNNNNSNQIKINITKVAGTLTITNTNTTLHQF